MGVRVDSEHRLVVNTSGHALLRAGAIVIGAVGVGILAVAIWFGEPVAAAAGLLLLAVGVVPPEYGATGVRIDFDDAEHRVVVCRLGGVTGRTLDRTVYTAAQARSAEVCYLSGVTDRPAVYDEHGDVQSTPQDVEWHRYDVMVGGTCIFSTQHGDVADCVVRRLGDVGVAVPA